MQDRGVHFILQHPLGHQPCLQAISTKSRGPNFAFIVLTWGTLPYRGTISADSERALIPLLVLIWGTFPNPRTISRKTEDLDFAFLLHISITSSILKSISAKPRRIGFHLAGPDIRYLALLMNHLCEIQDVRLHLPGHSLRRLALSRDRSAKCAGQIWPQDTLSYSKTISAKSGAADFLFLVMAEGTLPYQKTVWRDPGMSGLAARHFALFIDRSREVRVCRISFLQVCRSIDFNSRAHFGVLSIPVSELDWPCVDLGQWNNILLPFQSSCSKMLTYTTLSSSKTSEYEMIVTWVSPIWLIPFCQLAALNTREHWPWLQASTSTVFLYPFLSLFPV